MLEESVRAVYSNKWPNVRFGEEMTQAVLIQVNFTHLIWSSVTIMPFVFQVGNAALATQLSNDLLHDHHIYIQAINYPTVPLGQERLRIAPTPHHTTAMMDDLVDRLVHVWKKNGLELYQDRCPNSCEFCRKPLEFERFFARDPICDRSNCTYSSLQTVMCQA